MADLIPDKRYFTIGEVSKLCDIKPHVLRYWEQEFPVLQSVDRRSTRRYYQRKDVLTILRIKHLLREDGFTISGARLKLRSGESSDNSESPKVNKSVAKQELEAILSILRGE
ncbi:MAG: MerR family transcriptional regulator [Burkholderiales bacterium]|nr:MerR family transcriptional regulator [Burkholderiales bacterium]